MRSNILPMKYPAITSWQWQANMFAVLANYSQAKPWIMTHFIPLQLTLNKGSTYVDFYRTPSFEFCPWFLRQHLSRQLIRHFNKDICTFLMDCIDMNNYIYVLLDQSQFLDTKDFFSHDSFIFGYDEERGIFHIADFTFNSKYSFAEITFEQMKRAYEGIDNDGDWLYAGKGGLSLLQYNDRAAYDFNLNYVIEQLEDFLNGGSPSDKYRELGYMTNPCVWGINVYEELILETNRIRTGQNAEDRRPFQVIYDHKILMLERIDFMDQAGLLEEGKQLKVCYQSIADDALMARNLIIKYSLTKNKDNLMKVEVLIRRIQACEREAMELMIRNLSLVSNMNPTGKEGVV
ncbi:MULTISPECIES: hypothetical protein [Paenibacillus]|uniref:hypothetical protein n=1 Tax=Paenibacillus TaxID=44249 RepID=UPI001F2FD9FA|nr:hypothetical protein [Paenibacillus sp. JJ-223]CAH1191913.1 hypothetical protein PAECIP111890_00586 [Paenibacillus sp. JJ-223]